ncbi:MAG: hypothetical protein E3J72_12035 [Planctomycetota bacterium]|nr:MAG: hypothetical protein E3J72_12035 [Planctomycetota bacterium]
MTNNLSNTYGEFIQAWRKLLIEYNFIKSCHIDPLPGMINNGMVPQEDLAPFMASNFYLRLGSILDEYLQTFIETNGLRIPKKKYRNSLHGRIEFLSDMNKLKDGGELHRIREKRNDIAHKINAKATWDDFERDLNIIEQELMNHGVIIRRPKYEVLGERKLRKDINEPGVVFGHDFICYIKEDGKVVLEMKWSVKYYDSEHSK